MSAGYTLLPTSTPPSSPSSTSGRTGRTYRPTSFGPSNPTARPRRTLVLLTALLSTIGILTGLVLVTDSGFNSALALVRPLKDVSLVLNGGEGRVLTATSQASTRYQSETASGAPNATHKHTIALQKPRKCTRTLLYKFAGSHGFASEYLIFLRVAFLARRYKYALYIDDSGWNYGRWSDYFEPIQNNCLEPKDVQIIERTPIDAHANDPALSKISKRPPLWTKSKHVTWSSRRLEYLDELVLALTVNRNSLEQLQEIDLLQFPPISPLTARMTVPAVFKGSFNRMSQELGHFWSLNQEMKNMSDTTSAIMGWNDSKNQSDPRPIVIAAHIRLGDKAMEMSNYGPQVFAKPPSYLKNLYLAWWKHYKAAKAMLTSAKNGPSAKQPNIAISQESVEAYMKAALNAAEAAGADFTHEAGDEKPTLVLMSDDTSGTGLQPFFQHAHAKKFTIVTGLPAQSTSPKRSTNTEISPGFSENAFNSLDMSTRVGMTQDFIRDLTVLASRADGLVFTGSSNVGRLMSLLAGTEKMRQGRLFSVDYRWFPTVRYQ